ncbi:uncharacterized protein MONOS_13835 [Monocercomonoides exilis]|uniref:uncharacterized protein n=1 Tax=Monocercomonoides exilis TaxID=2049356 RepID=UPI003559EB1C|nr:hypothetical protein MONOS_13835 [Monocercomonoides exilis]|eukprot:MONOS_13835.1-p1 / transcript=MONOS_13835.1 / gene=MONOS_13835 / organism=Monocercomonoides_exilis_PA203 / gene_product=unspecified product / transcript_product=unspecified product / location=Mono_scaffold00891:7719-8090(-) / protein_length=124 / sequence_SO=supercontig / SO=protein_coding / is_pseudo=false
MQLAGRARVPRELLTPKDLSSLQRPVFFRESWRPYPGLRSRVGEDCSGRSDYGAHSTDLERKKRKGTHKEGEWTIQKVYRREERRTSECGVDPRVVEDRSAELAERRPGLLPKQHFLYSEKEQ